MGQTLTSLVYHVVFSTKGRAPLIRHDILVEMPPYVATLVAEMEGHALAANATSDHLHLFARLPAKLSLSDAVKFVNANSSRWVSQRQPTGPGFAWQAGYAAFTVSPTDAEGVRVYIENQTTRHKELDYKAELRNLLSAHGVEWDERYV